MKRTDPFLSKQDLTRLPVCVFVAIWVTAVAVSMTSNPAQTLPLVGISAGLLSLCWLVIRITRNVWPPDADDVRDGWGLLAAAAILLIWQLAPWPQLDSKDQWQVELIVRKSVMLVVIPLVVMKTRKASLSSAGLTVRDWKRHLVTGAVVLAAMVIPSAFYSATASHILGGKLGFGPIAVGLPASIAYFGVLAGFPEEFFFRAFVQTRLTALLRSPIAGILAASFLFGMVHIPALVKASPNPSLAKAFVAAFFVQTFIGIVFGVVWERTRNLIPCVLVHSGIDGVNNLAWMVSAIGL